MNELKKLIEAAITNGTVVEWKKGLPTGVVFQNHRGCYGFVREYDLAECLCTQCGNVHQRHRGDWKETYACRTCKGSGASSYRPTEVKSSFVRTQVVENDPIAMRLAAVKKAKADAEAQKARDLRTLANLRELAQIDTLSTEEQEMLADLEAKYQA